MSVKKMIAPLQIFNLEAKGFGFVIQFKGIFIPTSIFATFAKNDNTFCLPEKIKLTKA